MTENSISDLLNILAEMKILLKFKKTMQLKMIIVKCMVAD